MAVGKKAIFNERIGIKLGEIGDKLIVRRLILQNGIELGLSVLSLIMALTYLVSYRMHPAHPHIGGDLGWWAWFDQTRYYKDALAWSNLDLDPTQHWYMPGYALLAAPFVRLFSVHGFAAANLVCLIGSLWLFAAISGRLAKDLPRARLLGGLIFATVTCASPLIMDSWVVPWTTSGSTPVTYACLLSAICFIEQPRRSIFAAWCGFFAGLLVAFRPTDMIPVLAAAGLGMIASSLRLQGGIRLMVRAGLFGVCGTASALAVVGVAYVSVHGMAASDYITVSGMIGFEWRNLPLRWVILMLDPRPLYTNGSGMIEMFPWMVAGFAGMAALMSCAGYRRDRLAMATVVVAMFLHMGLYLAYRDLHPGGLFTFRNYHYFKWLMPFFGLYAAAGAVAVLIGHGARVRMMLAAAVFLAVLLPWRAELRVLDSNLPHVVAGDGHSASFESGLAALSDAILVPASGEADDFYYGPESLTVAGTTFGYFGEVRSFPRPGGFMLIPLRSLPAGPAKLVNRTATVMDPTLKWLLARQEVVFGLPCIIPARYFDCPSIEPIAAPLWPSTGRVDFSGGEQKYLGRGWSVGQEGGRWTDGYDARVRVRPIKLDQDLTITIQASGYSPGGSAPVRFRLRINDLVVAEHTMPSLGREAFSINVPNGLVQGADMIDLAIGIDNPRAPRSVDANSQDGRLLGLFVHAIEVGPARR